MEWLLSQLNFSTKYDIKCSCDININHIDKTVITLNNNMNTNGYGIIFDIYVITLNHIIENINNYDINKEEYDILFRIDIYDIIVLIKKNKNRNIKNFIEQFNKFYDNNSIFTFDEILNIDDNTELKITNTKLHVNYKNISLLELKSKLYPKIPMLVAESDQLIYKNMEINGLSGSIIHIDKKIIGLLTSINQDSEFEILPLHIIKLLIESYVKNEFKFYCLPINYHQLLDNSNTNTLYIDKSMTPILQQHDIIVKIDGKNIEQNKSKYDEILNVSIPIDTFILLHGKTYIDIEYKKKMKTKINPNNLHIDNIRLEELNFNKTEIICDDVDVDVELFGLKFKQLSEEYLLKCINNQIQIPQIDYSFKFSDKKIIILYDFSPNIKHQILDILHKNNININENLYRISKISKQDINSLADIEYHNKLDKKKITLQFLNIDNSTNTILLQS